jgi:2-polyprenyl-6-hydroxyphenyl methylase/3-demethylubiquinone-9 3-methyltransferase
MEARFEFGRNWKNYIEHHFSQERVDVSRRHMLEFLGRNDLSGLTIMDIGCGSGLHSLAAWQSGAATVISFDYDANSVKATRILHDHVGRPANWEIFQGSVLDEAYMRSLPTVDLVYSWGVLHHTGDVWKAVRFASIPVKPDGQFYIALYSADVQKPPFTPEFWLKVKQEYLHGSSLKKRYLEAWYVWRFMLGGRPWRLPEFLRRRSEYMRERGMDMMTDIRDWLGGWPMEFCYDDDVRRFAEKELGMELVRIATGEANTEFLFRRPSSMATGSG